MDLVWVIRISIFGSQPSRSRVKTSGSQMVSSMRKETRKVKSHENETRGLRRRLSLRERREKKVVDECG